MLFICGSDLFIYLCAMGRNFFCGDPLCASRRQQAGQGEGPRQSRNKNLLRYINFDGTPRCNECYAASRKKDAMPVANRTRAGGGPVSEGLPEGRNGKRQRTDVLGLLADGNGVNNGEDDEDDKDGHHLDDRHDHFQKGSDTSTGNGVNTHRRFSDDDDVDDHDSERCDKCDERLPALSKRAL